MIFVNYPGIPHKRKNIQEDNAGKKAMMDLFQKYFNIKPKKRALIINDDNRLTNRWDPEHQTCNKKNSNTNDDRTENTFKHLQFSKKLC